MHRTRSISALHLTNAMHFYIMQLKFTYAPCYGDTGATHPVEGASLCPGYAAIPGATHPPDASHPIIKCVAFYKCDALSDNAIESHPTSLPWGCQGYTPGRRGIPMPRVHHGQVQRISQMHRTRSISALHFPNAMHFLLNPQRHTHLLI